MRGRCWRRYKQDVKVIKRLKALVRYYTVMDANQNKISDYKWTDFIGTETHFLYKSCTTSDSRYKDKWGRKGRGYYDNDGMTRIKDKKLFKKMLEQDYGIKHLNICYGFTEINTE